MLVFLLTVSPLSVLAQEVPSVESSGVTEQTSAPTEIILQESGFQESTPVIEPSAPPEGQADTLGPVDENKIKESPVEEDQKPKDPPMKSSYAPQPQAFDPRDLPNGNRPKTDEITGALLYTYPLTVPPGRNGLDPKLALQYSSQATEMNSPFGYGWSINIPYIERSNKTGVEKLYTDNYFTSSLSGELVNVSSGVYAPKVENGDYFKYALSSNVWTVTDKNGTTYKFGINAGSRQDNAGNTSNVYKWMLEEVRDTNNNYIKYTYYKDAGQIYPDTITYTGNNTTDGIFTVVFTRSSRSDALTQNKGGFDITTNYKITEIQAKVSGGWTRKYVLSYTTGDNTQKSLLNTITESGQDESSNVTTLPAVTFTYQAANSSSPFANGGWGSPNVNIDTRSQYGDLVIDVNSDGLPDVLHSYEGSSWIKGAYINNGDGTWTTSTEYTPPIKFASSASPYDYGVRAADVNGDSRADLVQSIDGLGISIHDVYINTGSGWSLDTNWVPPYEFSNPTFGDTGGRMGDINGDGLPDFYKYNSPVYLNTGSGWSANTGWALPADMRYGVMPVDYNGDGLLDFLKGYRNNLGVDTKTAYKNNGDKTWSTDSTYTPPIIFAIHNSGAVFPDDVGVRVMDINGDGLQDIVKSSDVANSNQRETYLNTGRGWISSSHLLGAYFIGFYGEDSGARYGDFDGDGMVDFYYSGPSIGTTLQKHTKLKSDLLSTVTNQYGGVTTVTYKGSPKYMNGSTRLNPNLPYVLDTVYQISSDYGFGNPAETETYTYEGGEYYFNTYLDRKPAGFAKILKVDGANNKVTNFYHQGNSTNSSQGEYSDHSSKISKTYRTEVADSSGNIYQKIVNKWDKYNQGTGRDFVKLVRNTILTYDGDSDHKDTTTEYAYDDTYGNVTTKTMWGEVSASDDGSYTDTGLDKAVQTITYTTNTTDYIVGLPYQDTVVNQGSSKVRETKTYYDAQSLGTVTDGNPTKVEQWKDSTNYINTQKSYNTMYGIVASETDPRGKITSYTYDTYNLYPASVTNPLSQVTSYTYDYSLGKPKHVTDQNNFVYQTIYDGLDRVIAEKIPDVYYPHASVDKTTYVFTDVPGASSVKMSRHLDGVISRDSYVYFDGLGRKIQEREEGETSYNVRDYLYNNIGVLQKESLPYSSFGSSKTAATTQLSLYTNYTYDLMLRPQNVTNVVGTTGYVYDDWKTSVTDPRSKVKHYYKDAYNNLAKVDEVNDGSTYTTQYDWNLNGKLIKVTDTLGNVRNFTYDGLGRRLYAEDLHVPSDTTFGTWTYIYDDAGNMTQSTNPESQIVDYIYDDLNRALTENYTGASGTEIVYTYDTCLNGIGKLCGVLQPKSELVFEYNPAGLVNKDTREIDGHFFTTSSIFDRQGNIVQSVSPDGDVFHYSYNNAGLLEKIEYSQAGMKSMARIIVDNLDYSPLNQVVYQKNGNGTETIKTYDSAKLYRLTRINTRVPSGNVPEEHAETFYPLSGDGYVGYSNPTWNTLHDATVGDTVSSGSTTAYIWSGRDLGKYYIYRYFVPFDTSILPDNATISAATLSVFVDNKINADNDGDDWITVVSTSQANPTTLGLSDFDQAGSIDNPIEGIDTSERKDITTVPAGAHLPFVLNSTGKEWISLTGNSLLGLREGHDVIDSPITYVLDNNEYDAIRIRTANWGDINHRPKLSVTYTIPVTGYLNFQDLNYIYDANGNITKITDVSNTGSSKIVDYVYDDLNRLMSATATNVAVGQLPYTQSFVYDAIGNITNKSDIGPYLYQGSNGQNYANPHAATLINGVAVAYDKNGNMLTDGILTNTWNYKQQLTHTNVNQDTLEYFYDHEGQRIRVRKGNEETYYPSKFYNIDPSGKRTKSIYAEDQLVATVEVVVDSVANIFYNHTDHLGSINVVTDASGAQVQLLDYFPFGAQRISSGTQSSQRQYIGEYFDVDTDLSYLNARYYDGNRGQFISQDPEFWMTLEKWLFDPQNQNAYAYARNNPINLSDPSGKSAIGNIIQSIKKTWSNLFTGNANSKSQIFTPVLNQQPVKNDTIKTTTWDPVTDRRIKTLNIDVQQPATNFINNTQTQLGITLRVTDAHRTYEEQEALYWSSRQAPYGPWKTDARGGESNHNFGRAIDVAVMEKGKAYVYPVNSQIADVAKKEGFLWGGDWRTDKKDYPHFEMPSQKNI